MTHGASPLARIIARNGLNRLETGCLGNIATYSMACKVTQIG